MDKAEQVAYNNASKVYIEQNKLRQLFYSFTKLLCSVQPADPISEYTLIQSFLSSISNHQRRGDLSTFKGLNRLRTLNWLR